jgi:acyl-CoA synthetase (AMP-forming)/AMP-acid ligase II
MAFDINNISESLNSILNNGVTISSSGTTGVPKTIFRSPENLKAVNEVAIQAQRITKKSKILTVTRMTHAGGLLAQTLAAFTLGCELKIQAFNAFSFLKDFEEYTHTFLTPAHMLAIMKTKGFEDCNLTGKYILGGSEPVSWNMIEEFVSRGAIVTPNWGMSEIGPLTINTEFDSLEKVKEYKKNAPLDASILGDRFWCQVKITNGELLVKGDTCAMTGWYQTGDKVTMVGSTMYYQGRVGTEIDLWNPKKQ